MPACRRVDRIHSHVSSGGFDTDDLTPGERLVVNVNLMLEAEVMNGGFHQFLSNSSGDRTEEIKQNLCDIGASETLRLLQRVTSVFPAGTAPTDREKRNELALRRYFGDSVSVSAAAASVLKSATSARLDCRRLSMAVAMEVIGVSFPDAHNDAKMLALWCEFERSGSSDARTR